MLQKNKKRIISILSVIFLILALFIPSISKAVTTCYCYSADLTGDGPGAYTRKDCPDTACQQGACKYDKCAPDTVPVTEIKDYKAPSTAPAPAPAGTPASKAILTWTPNVSIGQYTQNTKYTITSSTNILGKYIAIWYKFLVGIAGLLAMAMIIFGGVNWLTSGGSTAAIGDAQKTIASALIGLTLALLSYALLDIINPNLLTLNVPQIDSINFTGDYTVAGINLASEANTNSGSGPANTNFVSDFNKTRSALQTGYGKELPNMTPQGGVRTNADGSVDLHTVGRAADYPRDHGGSFDEYMTKLTSSGTFAYNYDVKDSNGNIVHQPVYYVNLPNNGGQIRIINETQNNCWHIDNGQKGENFNGKTF